MFIFIYLFALNVIYSVVFFSFLTDMGDPEEDDEPEEEVDIDEMSVGEPEDEDEEDDEPEDDEPADEPETQKSAKDKAGTFVLPVRTANKPRSKAEESDNNPGAALGLNLDSLSSGLAVKQPPKLLSKPAAPPGPAPAAPVRTARASATMPSTAATGTRIPDKAPTMAMSSTDVPSSSGALQGALEMEMASVSTALTTVATAAPAELVLRDPAVVRVEALANVSSHI